MSKSKSADAVSLIPLVVLLWIGYLASLLLIDLTFFPTPIFPYTYYVTSGIIALCTLVVWRITPARNWLGNALVPGIIILLSVGSVVLAYMAMPHRPGPATGLEAVLLRTMPLQLLALILTAWQYGWPAVIGFTAGISLFSIGYHMWFAAPGRPEMPAVTVVLIEAVSFLVVGYFIAALIQRLKEQQKTLALANAKLVQHAATLEELTISRERNRMARELHDTVAHTQSALSVQLETAKAYLDVDMVTAKQMLDSSITANRKGLQETRNALKSLRAAPLDDLGLTLALRRLAEQTAARANARLDLSLPDASLSLSTENEQVIYRIAQEALNNASQHANASTISVKLEATDSHVTLTIEDDGIGFDPEQTPAIGHYGLDGMKERAELSGGNLTADSRSGQGTTIRFTVEE